MRPWLEGQAGAGAPGFPLLGEPWGQGLGQG